MSHKYQRPIIERFWDRVSPEPNSGCWIWVGGLAGGDNGKIGEYGVLSKPSPNPGMVYAHRVAYEHYKGPIPKGFQIDHLCRVKCCVNPDHLEAVTPSVNSLRGISVNGTKTHCAKGHPFFGENLYEAAGRRYCRTCIRAHYEARKKRKANESR